MTDTADRTSSSIVIGVDIGGSGIKAAPVDVVAGALTEARRRIPTPQPATPGAVIDTVVELVSGFEMSGPVGVTLPAVVRSGAVRTAANIDPAWIGCDAASLLSAATGRAVTVLNDADAAGLAEVRHGAGRSVSGVVLMLTLGTGIGSALFVDGTLVPNTELGHLPMHGGVAEDFAAESIRVAQDLSWREFAERLQDYIGVLERLLWPDLIIIGGGVSKKSDKFLPHLTVSAPIAPAELRNDAGIVGAAIATPR